MNNPQDTVRETAQQLVATRLAGLAGPGAYGDLACTADRAATIAVQALDEQGMLTREHRGRTATAGSDLTAREVARASLPRQVADYRQPLTDFERNAGVLLPHLPTPDEVRNVSAKEAAAMVRPAGVDPLPPKWQGEDYLRRHPEDRRQMEANALPPAHPEPLVHTGSNVAHGDLTAGDGLCSWPENCPTPDQCARGCVVPASSNPAGPSDLDAILDDQPATTAEANRRMHLASFMFDLISDTTDPDTRANALTHLAACDPARALAGMAQLTRDGMRDQAAQAGITLAELLTLMRQALTDIHSENQD